MTMHNLQPHQQRVVDEKTELDARCNRLDVFILSPQFRALDDAERDRMRRQWLAMISYSSILGERIAAFKP